MRVNESGYEWMKVDTSGWEGIQVDGSGYKWMRVDTSGWEGMRVEESREMSHLMTANEKPQCIRSWYKKINNIKRFKHHKVKDNLEKKISLTA
jgi:hypothetical protein